MPTSQLSSPRVRVAEAPRLPGLFWEQLAITLAEALESAGVQANDPTFSGTALKAFYAARQPAADRPPQAA